MLSENLSCVLIVECVAKAGPESGFSLFWRATERKIRFEEEAEVKDA
jgi:hypothetical protein